MLKVHLPKNTIVHYYGENYVISFDHWTTVENGDLITAIRNLRVSMAKRELFSKGIGDWINIALDKEDLELITC